MGLGFFNKKQNIKNMKKLLSLLAFAAVYTLNTSAQIAEGFYHVQNAYTGRYISIEDNNPNNYPINTKAGTVNMAGIRTLKNMSRVSTSPSTVIYVKNISGNKYDLEGQGTSLYKISSNRLYIILDPQSDGSYKAKTSKYEGVELTISDGTDKDKDEDFLRNKAPESSYWKALPINNSDQYIGIKPDVQTNDGYYGTIFAGFAFKLASGGMKAYYINSAGGSQFSLKEYTDEIIPANMPVIIKCSSNDPASNKITPVASGGKNPSDNKLGGVYCACLVSKHLNAKLFDPTSMRLIGTDNGKLAFVKNPTNLVEGKYLPANKAYLSVTGAADILTQDGITAIVNIEAEEKNNAPEGTFTLTGVRIPDGVTPKAGVYIKNGKKVVIK